MYVNLVITLSMVCPNYFVLRINYAVVKKLHLPLFIPLEHEE